MLKKQEKDIPIENLRFFSDEELKYCIKYSIHSVKCPKNIKLLLVDLSDEYCLICKRGNNFVKNKN